MDQLSVKKIVLIFLTKSLKVFLDVKANIPFFIIKFIGIVYSIITSPCILNILTSIYELTTLK